MALDLDAVGRTDEPWERSWTADEALLYAVAVGAGQDDPLTELAWSTENTAGVEQQALPTFGIVLAQFGGPARRIGDFDPAMLVHAEQAIEVHRPLPVSGTMSLRRTVTDIFDKGSAALVVLRTDATDLASGEPLLSATSSVFIRGEGGFGGERGPSSKAQAPEGEPDTVLRCRTSVNQALLYRLTGDRNPLHSDPGFAARGGFDRPILHGLCTYGIVGRLLTGAFCAGDASRVTAMSGRFTKPVFPGEEIVVSAWVDGSADGTVRFRADNGDGEPVLNQGVFTHR